MNKFEPFLQAQTRDLSQPCDLQRSIIVVIVIQAHFII